jgi:hypothetical protein
VNLSAASLSLEAAIRERYKRFREQFGFDIIVRIDQKLAHAKKARN